ncbi:hypothetical protein BCR34DRAFT_622950 [Clohesyomyces aquaticus]|uniref:NAD(P)-binding protein n=1 Tax=Clohesyomyces aquaticus TaxID=1231657 RepID=A0A1Y1ZZ38_9PLEO|nr:hypothetical protein BCR34DRAFT_622950 [Clohesyomyces aquaticus]
MAPTNVLITGGNRGIGLELVKRFLAQPNTTVIAANRDPNHPSSKASADLPKGSGSKLIIVKCDAAIQADAFSAIKELETQHGISHLDIVVANAGFQSGFPMIKDVKRDDVIKHLDVNVFGVIAMYQATRELLMKSPEGKPIFAPVGSAAASLSKQPNIPNGAYGASKGLLNWYGVRINAEDEWLNTIILDPGWTQTDMGNGAATVFGHEHAPVPLDESTDGLYKVLTTATKEKYGGRVVDYTGQIMDW